MSRATLTAVIWREGDVFVSHCPELGVASCGDSPDHALSMLKEAVDLYLENAGQLGILDDIRSTLTPRCITNPRRTAAFTKEAIEMNIQEDQKTVNQPKKETRREFVKSSVKAGSILMAPTLASGSAHGASESAPSQLNSAHDMPVGRIGNLDVSRLFIGSNLISMNMHARDLLYVKALATHYNTREKIFETLRTCEEYGINMINLKSHNFERFNLSGYWNEWGGKMKWMADVITRDFDQFERKLVEHLELGASAAYVWGGASDIWYYEKKPDQIIKAFEIIKKYDVPAGIGAHRLEPIMFCEKEGVRPDFYFKTLHHDRYWSAHPKENRHFIEVYRPNSDDHDEFHDNLWCSDHEKTIEFMQDVDIPWIAFKVLAAGAIPADVGIDYAFENGADFICLGMFDFQVAEDAILSRKAIEKSRNRKREWFG